MIGFPGGLANAPGAGPELGAGVGGVSFGCVGGVNLRGVGAVVFGWALGGVTGFHPPPPHVPGAGAELPPPDGGRFAVFRSAGGGPPSGGVEEGGGALEEGGGALEEGGGALEPPAGGVCGGGGCRLFVGPGGGPLEAGGPVSTVVELPPPLPDPVKSGGAAPGAGASAPVALSFDCESSQRTIATRTGTRMPLGMVGITPRWRGSSSGCPAASAAA